MHTDEQWLLIFFLITWKGQKAKNSRSNADYKTLTRLYNHHTNSGVYQATILLLIKSKIFLSSAQMIIKENYNEAMYLLGA